MTDRDDLESRWQANEAELNRLRSMSGLGRDTSVPAGSRRSPGLL